MEPILRGVIVYSFLLVVFRIAGKRTLSEATTFDLILALIISETVQEALVDSDHSMTTAAILILTLVGADIGLSLLKQWSPTIESVVEGQPQLLIDKGRKLADHLNRERVDEADIIEAARAQAGIESLDQIKYAVVERGGKITIVPK